MKCLKYVVLLVGSIACQACADELASWSEHQGRVDWSLLGNARGTDVYIHYRLEGRIADITLKSGIYDSSHQLSRITIINGYFGCPDGSEPQYLEHAVSTTFDAVTHAKVDQREASLDGENIPVTPGSVIESAAKLVCAAAEAAPHSH